MSAQNAIDEGAELAERDWSAREVAWRQFRAELAAISNDFRVRLELCPQRERHELWLQLCDEMNAWFAVNSVPHPGPKPYTGPPPVDTIEHHGRVIELFADRQRT